jgi:DNA polymerase (family X)
MDLKRTVVETLEHLALYGELADENPFKVRAWQNAARTIRQLEGDFAALVASGGLQGVAGIGKGVLDVVASVAKGEPVAQLAAYEQEYPSGLLDVMSLPGLGPKKVRALWQELGISSLAELEYACHENRLVDLKGFGKKTQDKIKDALAGAKTRVGRLRMDEADGAAVALAATFLQAGAAGVHVVGALRRRTETVDRLSFVVHARDALGALAAIGAALVEPTSEPLDELPGVVGRAGGVVVEVAAVAEPDALGAALVVRTGAAAHVDVLRARAAERGFALAATGLTKGGARVPTPDEDAVYAALGLLTTTPERREVGVPLVEVGKARPKLIERADLRGALHTHTTASDGTASIEEMRAAAVARGLTYLGVSDHSKSSFYASGLPDDALVAQGARIDALNADGAPCRLLRGVESDILGDGALDYGEDVLARLDFVVASIHSRLGQQRDEMTARLVAAASHPRTTVVGHPTGRMLLGRKGADFDVEAFLDACAKSGCAVELNGNPARLDLREEHVALAKARGVPVSIAADAHSTGALDHLEYGVAIARRAGLTAEDVLNTRSVDELLRWNAARAARSG